MDLQMYQKHAKRTMNWDLSPNQQLSTMALGICGELGEVVAIHGELENASEVDNEAGDTFWYIANICTVLGIEWSIMFPDEVKKVPLQDGTNLAVIHAAAIADVAKKTVAHGHVLDIDTMYNSLRGLVESLLVILYYFGLDLGKVLENNQLKLMKRYPKGFSTERSINREV